MRYIALTVICLLAACTEIPKDQVLTADNMQICRWFNSSGLTRPTDIAVAQEVQKRGLDCHPDHIACAGYGLMKGTPQYDDCRRWRADMRLREQALNNEILLEENRADALYWHRRHWR